MDKDFAQRISWLDAARGIGIILVVYAHVLRSLVAMQRIPETSAWMLSDRLIYSFHMPLFFLISGLVSRHVPLRDSAPFLKGRGKAIVYPYFLWSLVQGTLIIVGGGAANHPIEAKALLAIPWEPIVQFWFLYALFLCQLTLLLPGGRTHLLLCTGLALSLPLFVAPSILTITCPNLVYFAIGVFLSLRRVDALLAPPGRRIVVLLLSCACFVGAFLLPEVRSWPYWWQPAPYIAAIAGGLGTLAVARFLAPAGKILIAIGQASMPIYLLHVMAVAVARVPLGRIAPSMPPPVLLLLLTLIGIGIPFLIARAAARLGAEQWLGFGRTAHGRPRLAAATRVGE